MPEPSKATNDLDTLSEALKKVGTFDKAAAALTERISSLGNALNSFTRSAPKKKRGAGYTKRRISKRTGKSSSH